MVWFSLFWRGCRARRADCEGQDTTVRSSAFLGVVCAQEVGREQRATQVECHCNAHGNKKWPFDKPEGVLVWRKPRTSLTKQKGFQNLRGTDVPRPVATTNFCPKPRQICSSCLFEGCNSAAPFLCRSSSSRSGILTVMRQVSYEFASGYRRS